MIKKFLPIVSVLFIAGFCAANVAAQRPRVTVAASEVNGTFRHAFTGKFKGSFNEIKILALGKGKLKVAFDLVYPHTDGTGALSANVGQATGIADISGDTAVYRSEEFGTCTITIKFVRPGTISVDQEGASACGFGHNVTAAGTYSRSSKVKPKFDPTLE